MKHGRKDGSVSPIPRTIFFDIKTHSILKQRLDRAFTLQTQRLWDCRLDRLAPAYHDRGTFIDMKLIAGLPHLKADWPVATTK